MTSDDACFDGGAKRLVFDRVRHVDLLFGLKFTKLLTAAVSSFVNFKPNKRSTCRTRSKTRRFAPPSKHASSLVINKWCGLTASKSSAHHRRKLQKWLPRCKRISQRSTRSFLKITAKVF